MAETGGPIRYDDLSAAALPRIGAAIAPMADAYARTIRNAIVDQMEPGPLRTGEDYFVPGTRTLYTASAPGQPPAVREALYRDAWETDPPIISRQAVIATVYNNRVVTTKSGRRYLLALLLDMGTDNMKPRPHIDSGVREGIRRMRERGLG